MKERPILFQGAMVRALLAGTKTQTRRAVKPQPWASCCIEEGLEGEPPFVYSALGGDGPGHDVHETRSPCRCPYGQPGDRLWVRENGWQRPERTPKMMRDGADTWAPYYFDADGITEQEAADFKAWGFKRRPSIHMPRAHSRIVLEVTGVRVERLNAITREDAIAEGIKGQTPDGPWLNYLRDCQGGYWFPEGRETAAIHSYTTLWESLNGAGSWYANPLVWVVEFRRVQQA